MSIWTGKDGYDSIKEFRDRTRRELLDRTSGDFAKDTVLEQPILDFLQRHLGFGGWDVLEVGCGFGKWAGPITAWGNHYEGIDPCQERVKYAVNNANHEAPCFPRFMVGSHLDIKRCGMADAVLFVTVLQHLTLSDAREALLACVDKVRPGGKMLMVESLIFGGDDAVVYGECKRIYNKLSQPSHMIPKPMHLLQEATPGFRWDTDGDFHVLTKER